MSIGGQREREREGVRNDQIIRSRTNIFSKGDSSQSVCKCEEIILVVLVHQKGER